MNRKNKKTKTRIFWWTKLYLPMSSIILIPLLISFLVTGTLTIKEVRGLTITNFFTRAVYEIVPKNVATFIIIWFFVFIVILAVARKIKPSDVFNGNHSVYLHDCYKRLWIANNILGYKKLQLIGISLPLQFEVIMNETFPEYIAESSITQYEEFDGEITAEWLNNIEQDSKILNVLICDTYDISLGSLEVRFASYPALKISSSLTHTKLRYNNPKLVRAVREEMQKIDKKFDELNLFLTTNPLNSQKIIGGSFTAMDRSGFKKITVVQMNDERIYDNEFVVFQSK